MSEDAAKLLQQRRERERRRQERWCSCVSCGELTCWLLVAVPLALLYRRVLVPFLASSPWVKSIKQRGVVESAADGLRYVGLDVDGKDPTSYSGAFAVWLHHKLYRAAVFVATADGLTLTLTAAAVVMVLVLLSWGISAGCKRLCMSSAEKELEAIEREMAEADDLLKQAMDSLPARERAKFMVELEELEKRQQKKQKAAQAKRPYDPMAGLDAVISSDDDCGGRGAGAGSNNSYRQQRRAKPKKSGRR